MALMKGARLGPYEIAGPIGSGGMGEVYRARDIRLERTVAIKVLPSHLSSNPDLRARFEREAKAISALQHPNVCVLYDVGRQEGVDFLVMEYLEGETLATRLARKPLTPDEALRIGIEIADALAKAHRSGIVHRDLKPGNVMLTKGGAKLMDFGLAKPHAFGGSSPAPLFSAVATMTKAESPITLAGTVLGTVQYMSPEQIEGREADARSDLFALGAVLYEMLTGKKAFEGKSQLSVASAILEKEPEPISVLRPLTPPALERIVRKCLAKDADERWQSAGDLASELRWITEAGGALPTTEAGADAGAPKHVVRGRGREQLAWALALAFLTAAIVSVVSYTRLARAPAPTIISEISPPEKTQFNFGGESGGPPALSPDGRALAFSAVDASGKTMLWIRSLDSLAAHPLAGTEGAASPFWSADSQALGFFANDKLKTIGASGGPALVVAAAPVPGGGSWSREGTILFVPDYQKGLYQVAASGGTPVRVLEPDASKYFAYAWPKFLPDGRHFLYRAGTLDPAGSSAVYFASMDGKENRLLLNVNGSATYASGLLLYVRGTTLMAQTFDPERGQLKGDARPVAERIVGDVGRDFFDASENGVLVYEAGGSVGERRLTWFDRAGKDSGATGEAATYYDVRLSPDGGKLASAKGDPSSDIWVDELARGVRMRLTIDPGTDHGAPVWSPDGNRMLFGTFRGKARSGIYQKPSNGAGSEELLLPAETSDPGIWPTSWSHDSKFILYSRGDVFNLTRADIWVLPPSGDRKPRLFVKTPVAAYDGQFSPDARWVAYTSKESGREEVYVVPFDGTKVLNTVPGSVTSPGGKWLVSPNGGRFPRWRRDGKEIFYLAPDNQMMAVQIEERGGSLEVRTAQPLFRAVAITSSPSSSPYDVSPDGKRFVINTSVDKSTPLTLVLNWTARLGNKP
jgi:Tol biopolymer transport system component